MKLTPFSSVEELLAALGCLEDVPSEDVVPALAHLLQTADGLASKTSDLDLIVAGLVHDLASALAPGVGDHAQAGAELVAPLLGRRVADLVEGHTDAKRYLVAIEASYARDLSPNSARTLVAQGGPMTKAERDAFEARRDCSALVRLRRADDAAKVPGRAVPPVGSWRNVLDKVASGNEANT